MQRHDAARITIIIIWLIITAALPAAQSADDQNSADENASMQFDSSRNAYVYSDTVVVRDQAVDDPHSLKDIPAFITVIELKPDAPRYETLPDILGGSVGVTIREFGGLGKMSTVSIRGSSPNQVLVLLDGVRINTASGGGGVDLSDIPMSDIDRIEILRGSDSAVFGNGAMGGVVNLITRKGSAGTATGVTATYGSYRTTRLNAHFSGPLRSGRFRIYVSGEHGDGDFPFLNDNGTAMNPDDDFTDIRTNNKLTSAAAGLWWRLPDTADWRITAGTDFYYADKGMPGIVTFPSEHATEIDRNLSANIHAVRGAPDGPIGEFTSDITARWAGTDFDDPLGEQIGVPLHTRQDDINLQGRIGWRIDTPPGTLDFAVYTDQSYLRDDDLNDPKRGGWAASAKIDRSLASDSLWITGVVRYDDYAHHSGRVSPKLGLRWFLTPDLSVKANIGTGFRMPSFDELYTNMGFITGNADLKPERSRSYDLGVTWEHRRARAELSVFRMETKDLIQYLLVAGFRFKPYNIGETRTVGVEADVAWEFLPGLRLSAAYTFLDAEDRTDDSNYFGKTVPGRIRHTFFSRLEWERGPLGAYAEWRYLDGNYLTRSNTKKLPVRRTGNVGITVKFGHGIQLGAEVKNITDNRVVDVRGFPLPPRSYFVSLSFRR